MFCNIFFLQSVGCLFTFLMVYAEEYKVLILMMPSLFFLLLFVLFVSYVRNHFLTKCIEDLHLFFFYYEFYSVTFYVYVFDTFVVNFRMWCEVGIQLYSFAHGYIVVSGPFVGKTILSLIELSLCPC